MSQKVSETQVLLCTRFRDCIFFGYTGQVSPINSNPPELYPNTFRTLSNLTSCLFSFPSKVGFAIFRGSLGSDIHRHTPRTISSLLETMAEVVKVSRVPVPVSRRLNLIRPYKA